MEKKTAACLRSVIFFRGSPLLCSANEEEGVLKASECDRICMQNRWDCSRCSARRSACACNRPTESCLGLSVLLPLLLLLGWWWLRRMA